MPTTVILYVGTEKGGTEGMPWGPVPLGKRHRECQRHLSYMWGERGAGRREGLPQLSCIVGEGGGGDGKGKACRSCHV